MPQRPKDALFAQSGAPEAFKFNEAVAEVFEDMLERSVPLYRECLEMAAAWSLRFARNGSCIYDLGCSTGTLLSRIGEKLPVGADIRLVGVDNSVPMLNKARTKLKEAGISCELIEADLEQEFPLRQASVVVMNYTLQFIPPSRRSTVVASLYEKMLPGGCMILIEKVLAENTRLADTVSELHHDFKRAQGYSNLEISQKRDALENVLIPIKTSENIALLHNAGFSAVEIFFKWNNFAGFIALK